MNKKLIIALMLIGLFVVVLLLTKGTTKVNLVFDIISVPTSMALLGAAAVGVSVGLNLK